MPPTQNNEETPGQPGVCPCQQIGNWLIKLRVNVELRQQVWEEYCTEIPDAECLCFHTWVRSHRFFANFTLQDIDEIIVLILND